MIWTFVLMILAGLLIGGTISLWQQKFPRWIPVMFAVLAALALVGAGLFAWS